MHCIVSLNIVQFGACLNPVTVGKESIDLYEGTLLIIKLAMSAHFPTKQGKRRPKEEFCFYITLNFIHVADVRFESLVAECSEFTAKQSYH